MWKSLRRLGAQKDASRGASVIFITPLPPTRATFKSTVTVSVASAMFSFKFVLSFKLNTLIRPKLEKALAIIN
ncbi:hypothetical protein ACLKA6_016717 [Drosophila palustris]